MTTASSSYVPCHAHQPRGKRPWCPTCDTDLHLEVESPAVPGRQDDTLVVAVLCSKCGRSRVLDTTAEHVAALAAHLAKPKDMIHNSGGYSPCPEPTRPPASLAATTLRTLPGGGIGPVGLDVLDAQSFTAGAPFQVELPC